MSYKNGASRVTLQFVDGSFSAIIAHTDGKSTNVREIYKGASKTDALQSVARYSVEAQLPSLSVYPAGLIITQEEEEFLERQSGGAARIVYSR